MRSERVKKRANPNGPAPARSAFQILSLSGGGFRGLFSVVVLEELGRCVGRPLRECSHLDQ